MKSLFKATIILFAFFTSCSNKNHIPSNIIDQESMGKILFDLALAEEFAMSFVAKDAKSDKDSAIAIEVEKVMKIHHISQEEFRKSYEFYKRRPDLLKIIVDTVHARSLRGREKLYKGRPKAE